MKIAVICHFSNSEVQSKIKPWKKINEFAPWISYYINEFNKYPEHEFYIISPHQWLFKDVKYSENNIHFYFFRWGIPFIGRHWPGIINIDFFTKYSSNKRKVKKYIDEINPDVITLFGAENPYYSSTIVPFFGEYPLLLIIQGFINRSLKADKLSKYMEYRLLLEKEILANINNQCIRTDDMLDYAKKKNTKLKAFRFNFPNPYGSLKIPEKTKEFDFVFFARVVKDKGIYDFLEAINYIKKNKKNVSAIILGPCGKIMQKNIKLYCENNLLSENITLGGFVKTQKALFEKVKTAKISVLPTYNDIISGTIIESMFLNLPVVTYKTGSIPEVNKERENIIICEQGNVEELQLNMLDLLNNADKQQELSKNGFNWVSQRYNNDIAIKGYFDSLKQIIEDFKQ